MAVRRALFRFSRELERQIVPGLDCSQHTFESRLQNQIKPTHAWLDIGCGHARRSTSEEEIVRNCRLVGVDLELPALARRRPGARHRTLAALASIPLNFVATVTALRMWGALGTTVVKAAESCLSVAVASVLLLGTRRARRDP